MSSTARRKQSWTSLSRTWKVSNILASLYRDACLGLRYLSRSTCGHSLILRLWYLTLRITGWENKTNIAPRAGHARLRKTRIATRPRPTHLDSKAMFSQSSTFHTPDNMADRIRQPLGHSASQSSLHASFSLGGIPSTTGTHHPHGTGSWASNSQSGTLPNSLNDPFLQSRSSYQSGYLMVCHLPRGLWSALLTFAYL
jgi:hypothetical protein